MKVFIIDDEEVNVFLLRKKLISEGLSEDKNIFSFLAAKEALSALSTGRDEELPDIVLLDLNMPEMDGWEFLDALAPFRARIKEKCSIYILTSSIALSDETRAKDNPMLAGFIRKPIRKEDISALRSQRG